MSKGPKKKRHVLRYIILAVLVILLLGYVSSCRYRQSLNGHRSRTDTSYSDDESSVKESSVKESSVKESSVKESSVKESSVKESSVKESSVKESSVKESSVEESSVEESSVEESSVEESSVEESSVEESSVEESSVEESSVEESSDSGIFDPKFRAMIDSYEKLIDEYVVFSNKLKEDPTNAELLSEFGVYLERYEDVMEKIDAIDKDKLSAADYLYLSRFLLRMRDKLKEVE